jgi:hypothetical protein
MAKKRTVKIADLNVNIGELQKKDPEILKKIHGGLSNPIVIVKPTTGTQGCGSQATYCTPPWRETRTYVCPPKI